MGIKPPPNFSKFNQSIKQHGIALSNYYGITILEENPRNNELINYIKKVFGNGIEWKERLEIMCDEVNIPGLQISTGEYRINGMPQFQYANGNTYNDINMSFLVDANSTQKKFLDTWLNFIYGMSGIDKKTNMISRVRYPNEYCLDIAIVKYERYGNGDTSKYKRYGNGDTSIQDILDEIIINSRDGYPSRAVYSARLIDAFPKSVSSLPLSSASSQILRMSVNFQYKYHRMNILEDDTIAPLVYGDLPK